VLNQEETSVDVAAVETAAVPETDEVAQPAPDFSKLTVAKLKVELTNRGLSTDGLKKDLLARLVEATASGAPTTAAAAPTQEVEDEEEVSEEVADVPAPAKRGRSKRSADDAIEAVTTKKRSTRTR
jgi:hypothetical protein